jgi:hypothetical protein
VRAILIMAALAWTTASAQPDTPPPTTEFLPDVPAILLDIQGFLEYQRALREDIEAGRYTLMRPSYRRELFAAQEVLYRLLAGVTAVGEISTQDRVAVYNAQSTIAAIVNVTSREREICEHGPPLGSHRLVVSCYSERERSAAKLRSQMLLKRLIQQTPQD